MTVDFLSEMQGCVTLAEAAERLRTVTGEKTLTEADVLGYALNGRLQLSVFLPRTAARCWGAPDGPFDEENPPNYDEGNPPNYFADQGPNAVDTEETTIGGLWDLPLVTPGSTQVLKRYNELRGQASGTMPEKMGPLVERGGTYCRLLTTDLVASPHSAIIPDNTFVVRTEVLEQFLEALKPALNHPSLLDKPLSGTERGSLYIIIAALAKHANIPIFTPTPAATKIREVASDNYQLEISQRNVEDKLKDVIQELGLEKHQP